MSATPAISIITPTFRREALLRQAHQMVLWQREQNFEWLILDDSPQPSAYFTVLSDPRIHYHHHAAGKLTVGAKRNWLAQRARADIIAHFDDDDVYAPDYLSTMMAHIEDACDFVKLSGWFVYSVSNAKFAYWDTLLTRGLHFRFSAARLLPVLFTDADAITFAENYKGYGFTYLYRKTVWQKHPFPEEDFNEDYQFAAAAVAAGARFKHLPDRDGLCIHVLHTDNASVCFPQYLLPDFMLERFFKPNVAAVLKR